MKKGKTYLCELDGQLCEVTIADVAGGGEYFKTIRKANQFFTLHPGPGMYVVWMTKAEFMKEYTVLGEIA
jgi:hypothetical protein